MTRCAVLQTTYIFLVSFLVSNCMKHDSSTQETSAYILGILETHLLTWDIVHYLLIRDLFQASYFLSLLNMTESLQCHLGISVGTGTVNCTELVVLSSYHHNNCSNWNSIIHENFTLDSKESQHTLNNISSLLIHWTSFLKSWKWNDPMHHLTTCFTLQDWHETTIKLPWNHYIHRVKEGEEY